MRGSCHCGKVAFSVAATPSEALECNCSICRRKGGLLAAVAPESFALETSRNALSVYTFGPGKIRHLFCRTCGCAPFAEGSDPEGKAMVVINLRCAEDLDLSKIKVVPFDGASY